MPHRKQEQPTPGTEEAFTSKLDEKHAILGKTKHYRNSTLFNVKPSYILVAYQFLKGNICHISSYTWLFAKNTS